MFDAFETLQTEVRDRVLTITINRPEALNALSPTVVTELRTVFAALRERVDQRDYAVRCVVLTGAGDKAFVAGADIKAMAEMTVAQADEYTAIAQELTEWIETLGLPVIAAVNGFALGGGVELAMSCDFIYASANASFGQPEVLLGLVPGFGGSVRLQNFVGQARAKELIMTGRRISAQEAKDWGLVNAVFGSRAELLAAAQATANEVLKVSPIAVTTAKRSIIETAHRDSAVGLGIERTAFVSMFSTEDMREGTRAFIAKETPNFRGA